MGTIDSVIELDNVSVDFPVFNASSRSIKSQFVRAVTGGKFGWSDKGHVVVHCLRDINLDIRKGDRVGLIGHNGSGKTTLLRVLSGIFYPTHGVARIRGDVVSLINIALGLDPEATGRENIKLRGSMMGWAPTRLKSLEEEIITFSGIGDFIDLPFRTYSTGMQLRLAFSISTAIEPQILVMDEWLSTGDEDFKIAAGKRLEKVVNSSEVLIIASHSRELIERNCTRVIWLEGGGVKADGPVDLVLKEYFR